METEYIISKPREEKWKNGMTSKTPGLKITVSNDKSLVELNTYYDNEVTAFVGIPTKHHSMGDELQRVIEILQEINHSLEG